MSHTSSAQQHDLIAFLSTNPDGTVEDIAKRYDVTPLEVIRLIPTAQVFDGAQFDTVWDDITQWGDVTTLVNNEDLILESKVNYRAELTVMASSTCAVKKA